MKIRELWIFLFWFLSIVSDKIRTADMAVWLARLKLVNTGLWRPTSDHFVSLPLFLSVDKLNYKI